MTSTSYSMQERFAAAKQALEQCDQLHLLAYYEALLPADRQHLLAQMESVDWQELGRLVESHVRQRPELKLPDRIDPAPCYPWPASPDLREKYRHARQLGEDLLRAGKVAAFTVAGGQGTRLGWNGPKGTFPATPIRKLPLFGCFAEYIRKAQQKYSCVIPWYVMTSPVNDAQTRHYLQENAYFGLDAGNVVVFPQGMMPALDLVSGKVLMESPSSIALSPNGHGGSLKALYTQGAVADMKNRGIEHISYVQVDNPSVRVVDPLFIGLHALDKAQMSSKMLPKAFPKEKLGNFCIVDGRMTVIEYSDLPDELAEQRLANGELRFRAGSIAIHVLRTDFVESLNTRAGGFALPYHRAEKKVPYLDLDTGQVVKPQNPNAVKLETFVFDALPFCTASIILQTDRIDEFAPIKNADGIDSPSTSRALQIERAARWLEARGVKVPRSEEGGVDAILEISPLTAIEPGDLADVKLPEQIERRASVLF
ncbi:MAG: UDPGP type 1 family protein [Phycisphaeraceae bacterium]|nr:UDPGP type 1 family protein [Phycisphaeraceae bacterium]